MHRKLFVVGFLFVLAIAMYWLLPDNKNNSQIPPIVPDKSSVIHRTTNEIVGNISAIEKQIRRTATNDPLASAYEMADFISQMLTSVPNERHATRTLLKGLQIAFFLNDYVMAAKTNKNLELSTTSIVDAFTNVTQDTAELKAKLVTYADFPGTLSNHYESIERIPRDKDNVAFIKSALTANGVRIDTESDLLMDCLRYAYHNNFINEMYGSDPKGTVGATSFTAELSSLVAASDAVYKHRFEKRFNLKPETVALLLNRFKQLPIHDVSPAGFEIPAHIR